MIALKANVEEEAKKQLKVTACLEGMKHCIGMPDLHAGKQFPIGAAFLTEGMVYPSLIGGDIGCGMTLYALEGTHRQHVEGKERTIASKLDGLEGAWSGDSIGRLKKSAVFSELALSYSDSLGTVGRGNHFAEVITLPMILPSCGDSKTRILWADRGFRGDLRQSNAQRATNR